MEIYLLICRVVWCIKRCISFYRSGHLAVLEWARAHGCPWDEERTVSAAAGGGHAAVLAWAWESGASWPMMGGEVISIPPTPDPVFIWRTTTEYLNICRGA
jgi:hypothetical protein